MSTQGLIQSLTRLQARFNANTTELDVLLQERDELTKRMGEISEQLKICRRTCKRVVASRLFERNGPKWTCIIFVLVGYGLGLFLSFVHSRKILREVFE